MTPWVILLRGVNVGGVTVRSADLAECLRGAGLRDVVTVLATGNAVVNVPDELGGPGPLDEQGLARLVEQALTATFGYGARIAVRSPARLADVAAAYPFTRRDDTHHPYLVFVESGQPLATLTARVSEAGASSGEQVAAGDGVLYWECPKGASTETPVAKMLASTSLAREVGTLTTRNLRTVDKIVTAATKVAVARGTNTGARL